MILLVGRYIPIMLLYCIVLHYLWGLMTLIDPQAQDATAPHILSALLQENHLAISGWLFFVATSALIALMNLRNRYKAWMLLMPQQFTLMLSMSSAILAVWLGQYGDGVVRSHGFILVDQLPIILAAACHTISILSDVLLLERRKLD